MKASRISKAWEEMKKKTIHSKLSGHNRGRTRGSTHQSSVQSQIVGKSSTKGIAECVPPCTQNTEGNGRW